MKKNIITISTLLFISFLTNLTFTQQKKIDIKVVVDNLPENSTVFITGNIDELGTWDFMRKMDRESEREWEFTVKADLGDTIQFKFTRGNWNSEAVDSAGVEFPNFIHEIKKDTTLSFRIPNWRDQAQQRIAITPQRLANKAGFLELIEGWKYKIGDDSSWAKTNFNDADWKTINPLLAKEDFSKLDWTGNIWFRNHIYIDSSLWNKPFGLYFINSGAAEVYLNGTLLYRFGKVGKSKEEEIFFIERSPRHLQFSGNNEQILAVRYSNHSADKMSKQGIHAGFSAHLGDLESFISGRIESVRSISIHQMAFGGFVLAFALMHLLLFIFYPKAIHNLYYSICMLAFAGVIYFGWQSNFTTSIMEAITISTLNSVAVQLSMVFGLLTAYSSRYEKIPKQYAVFLIGSALFIIQTIFFPEFGEPYIDYVFYAYVMAVAIEITRLTIKSKIISDKAGLNWLISVGFLIAMLFIVYQIFIIAGIVTQPLFGLRIVYVWGIIFLAVTVSIDLSKRIADTNKNLEKQLIQVKELSQKALEQERKAKEEELAKRLLEADNARKTKELEEARKLQLSMLPIKVPSVPNLDIAVYMKPATEVGGDYYDFKYNNNGALTIAIGDATGHGMKAGTMVATIKGLFTAENANTDIVSFLNKSNLVIRDMHLGNLYMAMLLVKIENKKLTLSSAGMPPALIFRNAAKSVEEVRLQALPLGGSSELKYSKKEIEFAAGDTLLLMSDGFPELFNKEKDFLGYDRAKELFLTYAHLDSNQIINRLCKYADDWRGETNQADDITFIVVKFK